MYNFLFSSKIHTFAPAKNKKLSADGGVAQPVRASDS